LKTRVVISIRPKTTFNVLGSHGELGVDSDTGRVLTRTPEDAYQEVKRLNVSEWRRYYIEELASGVCHDILDFGYWLSDGSYEPPEHSWRQMYRTLVRKRASHARV